MAASLTVEVRERATDGTERTRRTCFAGETFAEVLAAWREVKLEESTVTVDYLASAEQTRWVESLTPAGVSTTVRG